MPVAYDILCFLSLFFSFAAVTPTPSSSAATRRFLHQPLFPKDSDSIPPDSSSPTPTPTHKNFFPSYNSSPTPPPPTAPATFPGNISSLLFPKPSSPRRHPVVAIALSLSLLFVALVALLGFFIYCRKYTTPDKLSRSDSLRLYPPNTLPSDAIASSCTGEGGGTSSEFLYLGNVVNSLEACDRPGWPGTGTSATEAYRKLGSPELKPLPPLPRHRNRGTLEDDDDEEEFFSPRGSSGRKLSPSRTGSGRLLQLGMNRLGIGSRSFNSATTPSHVSLTSSSTGLNLSPKNSSPEINWNFSVGEQRKYSDEVEINVPIKKPPSPPSPPPLPPPRFWEASPSNNDDTRKPKFKPLHWDKVRANSDRAMAWVQLKPGSFQ